MKLTIEWDAGDAEEIETQRVDILRLERCTGVPWARLVREGFSATPYKLAWLAMQRSGHEVVDGYGDLGALTGEHLNRGAEALAAVAEVS